MENEPNPIGDLSANIRLSKNSHDSKCSLCDSFCSITRAFHRHDLATTVPVVMTMLRVSVGNLESDALNSKEMHRF
jgi:hypothetical protein